MHAAAVFVVARRALTAVCLPLACLSQRSSSRTRQAPVHYAEEQAQMQLHAAELLDLRHAEAASLESDVEQESPDEPSPPALSSSSDEEEEKEQPADAWSAETRHVNVPPFDAPIGKQHAARHADSPLSFLQLFLPPGLLQQWADYTNDYAQQRGAEREWRTTVEELYAFLGVHIYMGICPLPQWHMYWSEQYQQPFVAAVFPRWRFEQLLRYFHVAPPPPAVAAADPLSRVRPLIQSLQHSFPRHYAPSRCLTLDEAMVAFKGRSPIKQYIPSKPHKWGYKIYCLASDDYLLHFEVYQGKEEHPSPLGITYDTVMRMTTKYQHQQYFLFTDNWFTSPAVLDELKRRGIHCCGSVKRNRRGMPVIADAEMDALRQGEWLQRQKGDSTVAVWRDRKAMWLLYNHCSPEENASLQRWDDSGHKISVGCPRAIRDYFYGARSVDVSNQLHYSYLIGRKSKKAWSRLAWWLLDMCIVNAFQLWAIGKDASRQLNFREELMHSLVKLFGSNREAVQTSRGANASVALAKDHYSVLTQEDRDCAFCSHQPAQRTRTRYICAKCRKPLCIGQCFSRYHA
jgi:Transposase IS4